MGTTIQFKRGLDANLPSKAAVGEPLWTTDTHRLFVGTGGSIVEITGGSYSITSDDAWTSKGDLIVGTGPDAAAILPVGADGRVLVADSSEPSGVRWAAKIDAATIDGTLSVAHGGTGAATAANARANLGLSIGSDVQAFSPALLSIANLTTAADQIIYTTASNTYAVTPITEFGRSLIDDVGASAARATLGLGSIATQAASNVSITGGSITGIAALAIANGGTGASTAVSARANLGLGGLATLNAVGTAQISDGAVTRVKLAPDVQKHVCKLNRSSPQSIANEGSGTTVFFDTAEINTGDMADISNSAIIIRRSGRYLIVISSSSGDVTGAGQLWQATATVNGETRVIGRAWSPAANRNVTAFATAVLELTIGNYIRMIIYQNTGASRNTPTTSWDRPQLTVVEL